MKIFDDHNRMRVSILLLLALTMCPVASAEKKYPINVTESRIMSPLEKGRSYLSEYSEAGISARGDYQLPTEALFRQDEFLMDTNITYVSALKNQMNPKVAFDGTNYLVVWHDQRGGGSSKDIYGSRVNQDGVVLDSSGIVISNASNHQAYPAVAFDGSNFLVVWEDYRWGYGYVYGARVSQDGVVLDPSGIAIDTSVICYSEPTIAFDGTNYLVVWHVYAGSILREEIYGTRVSQDGVILDPSFIRISMNKADAQTEPSVTFDGANYLVVWWEKTWGQTLKLETIFETLRRIFLFCSNCCSIVAPALLTAE